MLNVWTYGVKPHTSSIYAVCMEFDAQWHHSLRPVVNIKTQTQKLGKPFFVLFKNFLLFLSSKIDLLFIWCMKYT